MAAYDDGLPGEAVAGERLLRFLGQYAADLLIGPLLAYDVDVAVFLYVDAVSFVFLLNPLEETVVLNNESSDWKWFKELPPMLLDILQPFGEVKI